MFQYSDNSTDFINSNNSELIKEIENKYNLAINFFQCEKYKESEEIILEILEIIPNNSDVYNFYGRLKQFQGDFNKSIELLKKSVEYDFFFLIMLQTHTIILILIGSSSGNLMQKIESFYKDYHNNFKIFTLQRFHLIS